MVFQFERHDLEKILKMLIALQRINMKSMKKSLLLSLLAILLSQCSNEKTADLPTERLTERAFYYWQTTMNFTETDDSLANLLKLQTVYVRYFDIDWSPGYKSGVPVGVLNGDNWNAEAHFRGRNIIPTVFITNRTFTNLKADELETLAKNTAKKINQISGNMENWYVSSLVSYSDFGDDYSAYQKVEDETRGEFKEMISEVQIDCDWTASTRDKFFKFLELLKPKLGNKTLSCTVRLHQYKDRKLMGIPPVERGLLMCYNVSDVQKMPTKNAILDAKIVKQYLKGKTYPIKLDIGLPMFSWAAWYRGKEFKGIVSGWNEVDAKDKSLYKLTSDNRYFMKSDTVIGNNYLREGDMLRWDNGFEEEMEKTIELLQENLDLSDIRISFFDWETEKIKRNESDIEKYYQAF